LQALLPFCKKIAGREGGILAYVVKEVIYDEIARGI
jgi:hypothetical protein